MSTTQLLILGNGFDLQCGLRSSYSEFLNSAILDGAFALNKVRKMRNDVTGFWEGLLYAYYKVYGDKNYKWCDIEKIILDTLWFICYGDKTKTGGATIRLWKKALVAARSGTSFFEAQSYADDIIKTYLLEACYRFFADNTDNTENSEADHLSLLLDFILRQLHNFEKRFCEYIKSDIFNEENEPNENYVVNACNLLAALTDFSSRNYRKLGDIVKTELREVTKKNSYSVSTNWKNVRVLSQEFSNLRSVHILSFNYTSLFDILGFKSPCAYGNVHGKLCMGNCKNECKGSNVIFGIDDTLIQEQSDHDELRLFSKTYRKMLDTGAPINILPSNDKLPVVIKFYGHSLSAADYSYFQSIFDYYNIYGNTKVALKFYYSKGYEQTDAIYRLINSYGKTLSNREQGKNLMHKLLVENRLKIVEVDMTDDRSGGA